MEISIVTLRWGEVYRWVCTTPPRNQAHWNYFHKSIFAEKVNLIVSGIHEQDYQFIASMIKCDVFVVPDLTRIKNAIIVTDSESNHIPDTCRLLKVPAIDPNAYTESLLKILEKIIHYLQGSKREARRDTSNAPTSIGFWSYALEQYFFRRHVQQDVKRLRVQDFFDDIVERYDFHGRNPKQEFTLCVKKIISTVNGAPHTKFNNCLITIRNAWDCTSDGTPFAFVFLFFTCFAQTRTTENNRDFRKHISSLLGVTNNTVLGNSFPKLWQELLEWSKYTKTKEESLQSSQLTNQFLRHWHAKLSTEDIKKEYRRSYQILTETLGVAQCSVLQLPDVNQNERIVGYAKNIAFPTLRDLGLIQNWLAAANLRTLEPRALLVTINNLEIVSLSREYRKEAEKFRDLCRNGEFVKAKMHPFYKDLLRVHTNIHQPKKQIKVDSREERDLELRLVQRNQKWKLRLYTRTDFKLSNPEWKWQKEDNHIWILTKADGNPIRGTKLLAQYSHFKRAFDRGYLCFNRFGHFLSTSIGSQIHSSSWILATESAQREFFERYEAVQDLRFKALTLNGASWRWFKNVEWKHKEEVITDFDMTISFVGGVKNDFHAYLAYPSTFPKVRVSSVAEVKIFSPQGEELTLQKETSIRENLHDWRVLSKEGPFEGFPEGRYKVIATIEDFESSTAFFDASRNTNNINKAKTDNTISKEVTIDQEATVNIERTIYGNNEHRYGLFATDPYVDTGLLGTWESSSTFEKQYKEEEEGILKELGLLRSHPSPLTLRAKPTTENDRNLNAMLDIIITRSEQHQLVAVGGESRAENFSEISRLFFDVMEGLSNSPWKWSVFWKTLESWQENGLVEFQREKTVYVHSKLRRRPPLKIQILPAKILKFGNYFRLWGGWTHHMKEVFTDAAKGKLDLQHFKYSSFYDVQDNKGALTPSFIKSKRGAAKEVFQTILDDYKEKMGVDEQLETISSSDKVTPLYFLLKRAYKESRDAFIERFPFYNHSEETYDIRKGKFVRNSNNESKRKKSKINLLRWAPNGHQDLYWLSIKACDKMHFFLFSSQREAIFSYYALSRIFEDGSHLIGPGVLYPLDAAMLINMYTGMPSGPILCDNGFEAHINYYYNISSMNRVKRIEDALLLGIKGLQNVEQLIQRLEDKSLQSIKQLQTYIQSKIGNSTE